jgi:hypothetical protein
MKTEVAYRQEAERIRVLGAGSKTADNRAVLLTVGETYDGLARWVIGVPLLARAAPALRGASNREHGAPLSRHHEKIKALPRS